MAAPPGSARSRRRGSPCRAAGSRAPRLAGPAPSPGRSAPRPARPGPPRPPGSRHSPPAGRAGAPRIGPSFVGEPLKRTRPVARSRDAAAHQVEGKNTPQQVVDHLRPKPQIHAVGGIGEEEGAQRADHPLHQRHHHHYHHRQPQCLLRFMWYREAITVKGCLGNPVL